MGTGIEADRTKSHPTNVQCSALSNEFRPSYTTNCWSTSQHHAYQAHDCARLHHHHHRFCRCKLGLITIQPCFPLHLCGTSRQHPQPPCTGPPSRGNRRTVMGPAAGSPPCLAPPARRSSCRAPTRGRSPRRRAGARWCGSAQSGQATG